MPDIDKAKDGFRSIQTEAELDLFKIRMRPLVVCGKLSSGRLSNRIPKNPAVLFTDASAKNGDSSVRSKTVAVFTYYWPTISNIVLTGRQDSRFWIVVQAKTGITIRGSNGWDESP